MPSVELLMGIYTVNVNEEFVNGKCLILRFLSTLKFYGYIYDPPVLRNLWYIFSYILGKKIIRNFLLLVNDKFASVTTR